MNNGKMIVSGIDGINSNYLQMVTIEEGLSSRWAIKNKYGDVTPFFENVPYISVYNDECLLFIGEKDGHKDIYVAYDVDSRDKDFYYKEKTIGDLLYLKELDKDVCIITTDKGEYLLDRSTLGQRSDLFNSIAFLDNRLIFKKVISYDGRDNAYFGEVDKNGKIGDYLYDEENDIFISTPLYEVKENSFDLIDEDKLEEILAKHCDTKSKIKKEKIKMLSRMNNAKKFNL